MSEGQHVLLLVEDDEDIRNIFKMVLTMKGFDILEATDGKEGLDLLEKDKSVKVVVLDLFMPNMNGLDFLKTLRGVYDHVDPGIPVIVVSAAPVNSPIATESRGLCDAYIQKPITIEKLIETLDGILKEHHGPEASPL